MIDPLQRLTLVWRKFTPLEERLIEATQTVLSKESIVLFDKQLKRINKAQRVLDWTEICFYSMKLWKVSWLYEISFPNRDELVLARIRFKAGNPARQFRTMVYAVNGHFFSFVTRPSPKAVAFARVVTILQAESGDDPMKIPDIKVEKKPVPSTNPLPELLQDWATKWEVGEMFFPLDEAVFTKFIIRYRDSLPNDFVVLCREVEGFRVGVWDVMGISDVYRISLSDSDYLVLASSAAQVLAVKENSEDSQLYFLDHDEAPVAKGTCFIAALNACLMESG